MWFHPKDSRITLDPPITLAEDTLNLPGSLTCSATGPKLWALSKHDQIHLLAHSILSLSLPFLGTSRPLQTAILWDQAGELSALKGNCVISDK